MQLLELHADKIVTLGMSCSGKTTFARQLSHPYWCFDAMFPWHEIETLGLSIEEALKRIRDNLPEKFVLDGWHLSDLDGRWFPDNAIVYVIYARYEKIIGQYRATVADPMQHWPMFKKWYVDYPNARYFKNDGEFVETTREEYRKLVFCDPSP